MIIKILEMVPSSRVKLVAETPLKLGNLCHRARLRVGNDVAVFVCKISFGAFIFPVIFLHLPVVDDHV